MAKRCENHVHLCKRYFFRKIPKIQINLMPDGKYLTYHQKNRLGKNNLINMDNFLRDIFLFPAEYWTLNISLVHFFWQTQQFISQKPQILDDKMVMNNIWNAFISAMANYAATSFTHLSRHIYLLFLFIHGRKARGKVGRLTFSAKSCGKRGKQEKCDHMQEKNA